MVNKTGGGNPYSRHVKIKVKFPLSLQVKENEFDKKDADLLQEELGDTVKVLGMARTGRGRPKEKNTVMFFPWQKVFNHRVFLKEDHWDQSQGNVPNRRSVGGVYGIGQPNEKGIERFFKDMDDSHRKVYWLNLRAEPTVFIKGESYTLRTRDEKFLQLEYQGASRKNIELFERNIKREILKKINHGKQLHICYDNEDKAYGVAFKPGEVKPDEVKTISDILKQYQDKYNLEYHRIPVSDRHFPTPRDIDKLMNVFNNCDIKDVCVVNCMLGRGRTTHVMTLLNIMNHVKENPQINFCRIPGMREHILEDGKGRFGRLRKVLSVARLAEKTSEIILGKEDAEDFQTIIDGQYAGQCHLLEAMPIGYARDRKAAKQYLKGYLDLAMFYRYCRQEAGNHLKPPFSQWIKKYKQPLKAATEILDRAFRAEKWIKNLKSTPKQLKIPGFPKEGKEIIW